MGFGGNLLNRSVSARKNEVIGPIGLDFGMDSLNLCQLKTRDEHRYSVLARAVVPYSSDSKELLVSPRLLKLQLGKTLKKNAFVGREVVAIMPADRVRIMPVTYKSSTRSPDDEILKILDTRLEGETSDYLIDYLPVRANAGDEEHLVLAAIAQRREVLNYLETLRNVGFRAQFLDIGPAALRRLIRSLYRGKEAETILVVNTGDRKSYLTIVSGGWLVFDQSVSFGEQVLIERLSDSLELPINVCRDLIVRHGFRPTAMGAQIGNAAVEGDVSQTLQEIIKPSFIKLAEEIKRVLIFTASETHGSPISRILLLGSIARWPGADGMLHDLINIPLTDNRLGFTEVFSDQTREGDWLERIPELAIATGLALRGIEGDE